MIALHLAGLLASDSGGEFVLLAAGPVGGGAIYAGLYRYYRNTDKSHSFETETKVAAQPVTGHEQKIDEIKGTKKTGIDGDNHTKHRQRVQRVP